MQAPQPQPKMGFNRFSELWNGRLAMIRFVTAMVVEVMTGQGILGQLGIM
ncbi:MAG: high light inducible protein [Cyanobacteria bacterium J06600_6]